MSIWWVSNALKHHHTFLLLIVIEVLRKVPRSWKHLFLYDTGNQLLLDSGLFRTELVRRIWDLVSIGDFLDSKSLEHSLTKLSWFILADLLWSDELTELLIFVLLLQRTCLVSIHLDIDLFDDLLEDLVIQVLEEVYQLSKWNAIILLKESNDIGLGTALNEVVELTTLGIIHLHCALGLNLPHKVHIWELSYVDWRISVLI